MVDVNKCVQTDRQQKDRAGEQSRSRERWNTNSSYEEGRYNARTRQCSELAIEGEDDDRGVGVCMQMAT
jgi:hypothetical protein